MANNKDILYYVVFLKQEYLLIARIAEQISLTNKQQNTLVLIATSRTHQQDHIQRAKIILLSFNGKKNKQIQS